MNLYIKNSIIVLIILLSITACTKDDYLTDSGIAKAETDLTAYEYLKAHKYQKFDTVIRIIDHFKLKDTINASGTFFVPNDYSVKLFLDYKTDSIRLRTHSETALYTLDNFLNDPKCNCFTVLQYVFGDKIKLATATTSGEEYENFQKKPITVKKIVTPNVPGSPYYVYSDTPVYFLYYCKEGKANEVCQTTDVMTQSGQGTVLHFLNNTHVFNRFTNQIQN